MRKESLADMFGFLVLVFVVSPMLCTRLIFRGLKSPKSLRNASLLFACTLLGRPLPATTRAPEPGYLIVGLGASQVLNEHKHFLYTGEYRFKWNFFGIHPYALAGSTTDGSPIYLGGGLLFNFDLYPRLRLTIGTGPGYYNHESSTKDLGFPNEFYSNIEISTQVWRGHRLGLSFGHISNASASSDNPGSETLRLQYAIPFS